jgi:hypothetical protein
MTLIFNFFTSLVHPGQSPKGTGRRPCSNVAKLPSFRPPYPPHGREWVNVPFLAERSDKSVRLFQVVTRYRREQVVIHLVLQSTAEPIHKGLREAVSTRNVTSRGDLQLPKVRSLVGTIGCHAVVAKSKDNRQQESARAGGHQEIGNRVERRETTESSAKHVHPAVVQDNTGLLQERVLKTL